MTPCDCGNEGTVYRVPNPGLGVMEDKRFCHDCRREHHPPSDAWVRSGGYCPGCRCETWRFVEHPRFGVRIPLWPDPTSVRAYFHIMTDGGDSLVFQQHCADCVPPIGAMPTHTIEGVLAPGQPHPVGPCVRHEDVRVVYAAQFTDAYGEFLRAWLADELRLDETEIDRYLYLWAKDRAA